VAQFTLSPQKLVDARKAGHEKLKLERERRAERIRAFTGPDYGEKNAKGGRRMYLNLIHQAGRTLAAYLVPRSPGAAVTPKKLEAGPDSIALEYSLTAWAEESRLKELMRRIVMEALVSPFAIVRIGLKANGDVLKSDDRNIDLGMPYAGLVDFDDYVLDPAARNRDEALFEAVRYECPREYALALPIFDAAAQEIIKKLPSLDEDSKADEKQGRISPTHTDEYELTDRIELWDHFVYDNDEVWVVTMPAGASFENEVLAVEKYQGALRGPLEVMYFNAVPGNNPMPLAPFAPLLRISEAADEVFSKMLNQLKKAKTVFAYNRGAEEDAESVGKAKDLGGVAMDDVNSVKALPIAGIMDQFMQATNWLDGHWNTASGNLHTVSGGSDPRKTATASTQDNANAGLVLADMQETTREFTTRILQRVGFYFADDPLFQWYGVRRIKGGHMVPVEYSPEDRQSDPFDHDIRVDSITMEPKDPSLQMRRLMEFLQVLPTVLTNPLIDPVKFMRFSSRKMQEPELEEIVVPQMQMAMQAAGAPATPPVPGGVPKPTRPGAGPAGAAPGAPAYQSPIDAQRAALAPIMAGQ